MHFDWRRLSGRLAVLASFAALCAAASARAADSSKSSDPGIPLGSELKGSCSVDVEWSIDDLATSYRRGSWSEFEVRLRKALLGCNPALVDKQLGASYSVVFLDKTGPNPVLVRSALRSSAPAYTARLIESDLYDIQLGLSQNEILTTAYSATRSEDPLVAALPKFFGQFDKAVLGIAHGYEMDYVARPTKKHTITLTVRRVTIPKDMRRSQVTLNDVLIFATSSIKARAAELEKRIKEKMVKGCAEVTNEALKHVIETCPHEDKCPDLGDLQAAFASAFRQCKDDQQKRDAQAVFVDYAALGDQKAQLTGTTTYSLAPLTHVTLGVGVAAIAKTGLNERIKIDSGKIASDPPTAAAGIAVFDYHPIGFDDSTPEPTFAERFHLLGGFVINPDPGVYAGIGFAIIRGLSIHGGYGVLLSKVLRSDDKIGEAPTNPEKPSKRGALGVVLAGFEYSFNP
jgi:hypothetical protein